MASVANVRIFSFFSTLIIVPIITYGVILFARGYRPDFQTNKLEPTGILAATSHPESAQIIINNEIKTATNNSLNLPLGEYEIQIKKEGFHTWTKKVLIEKEVVTRANAYLFANIPTLKAITTENVTKTLVSPSMDKVVYISNSNLMFLDLSESPLGLTTKEPKVLLANISNKFSPSWSPNSQQVLLQSSSSAQLVDISSTRVSEVSIGLPNLLADWKIQNQNIYSRQLSTLSKQLQEFIATVSGQIMWSNSDKKLLYTATASATMPTQFIPPLPGSNTQSQSRSLLPNHTYAYDIEEDRNFELGPSTEKWHWYPTGNHVYRIDKNNIHIKEYDNSNSIVLFAGNLSENFAVPYPSGKQLLVLTNTNPTISPIFSLYSVNLK